MLGFAAAAEPNSRLSCQITMCEELDGLRVRMPEGSAGRSARASATSGITIRA
jgi:hypothetical protein